ncbi:MAG: helix-turn-helix domain-containing protein [Pseudomonadota bacterium]|nr:helix-turn-helix domain-containing protein [Pseudomonadota bacterium]
MSYRHLTLEPRYQIAALYRAGYSNKEIAVEIGCHPSTISRELQRNGDGKDYDPKFRS